MKASHELRARLASAIEGDTAELRSKYQTAGLSDKRYRWDLLWKAIDRKTFDLQDAYGEGLNDSHIDTMLRAIVPNS